MDADVRITVMKRLHHDDMLTECADAIWPPCERLAVGQEFVASGANMPAGFCSWAWVDIKQYVMTLARGGNFRGVKPGMYVTCCTDGFRPVVFRLARIET